MMGRRQVLSFPEAVLIGYGSIGRLHGHVLSAKTESLTVVDLSDQARMRAMGALPGAHVASSLDDISHKVDWSTAVVTIATLGPSHREIFESVVALGARRVLCEKPLATSVADAAAMAELARRKGVALAVNHHMRYSGVVAGLRSVAESFDLGEPVAFRVIGGAKCLVTNGIHWVDLASHVFGESPAIVVSNAAGSLINPRSKNLRYFGGTAIYTFIDGREATLSFSNLMSVSETLLVHYRDALIVCDPFFDARAYRRPLSAGARELPITRCGPATEEFFRGPLPGLLSLEETVGIILDEVVSGAVSGCPPEVGQEAVGACIGALASGRDGRSVSLPIASDDELASTRWPIS